MSKPIFPDIDIYQEKGLVEMRTTLRKEFEGKWYLWNFYRKIEGVSLQQCLNVMIHEIYITILIGIPDPKITLSDGTPLFELDDDQRSEEERLRLILHENG